MRVTNLMVEDWVEVIKNSKKRFAQVQMIDGYGDNATSNECLCDAIYYSIDELNPIPLTAEILERNGFKDIGDNIYQLEEKQFWFWVDFMNHQYGCEFDTSTYEYESSEHRLKLYGLPSVHELQHALKLCGIEKNIQL